MKPMNHRLFKLIILLAFWAGLELSMTLHGHSEVLNRIPQSKPVVQYHWKALNNYIRLLEWRQLLYGKRKAQVKKQTLDNRNVPDDEFSSPYPPESERRQRTEQLASAQRKKTFLLASTIPQTKRNRENLRRSNHPSLKSSQGQRTVYRQACQVSAGGQT